MIGAWLKIMWEEKYNFLVVMLSLYILDQQTWSMFVTQPAMYLPLTIVY